MSENFRGEDFFDSHCTYLRRWRLFFRCWSLGGWHWPTRWIHRLNQTWILGDHLPQFITHRLTVHLRTDPTLFQIMRRIPALEVTGRLLHDVRGKADGSTVRLAVVCHLVMNTSGQLCYCWPRKYSLFQLKKHSQSVNLRQGATLNFVERNISRQITSVRLPNLVKISLKHNQAIATETLSLWRFWPWTLTLTFQKLIVTFGTDEDHPWQISWKSDVYFLRKHFRRAPC